MVHPLTDADGRKPKEGRPQDKSTNIDASGTERKRMGETPQNKNTGGDVNADINGRKQKDNPP